MRADLVVVDASAIVAFLFNEPTAPQIEQELSDRLLAAPALLTCEVASAAAKKTALYPEQAEGIERALHELDRLRIEYWHTPAHDLFDMARKLGLSVYDAAYLWVAMELRAPLVTLDLALAGAAGKARIRSRPAEPREPDRVGSAD